MNRFDKTNKNVTQKKNQYSLKETILCLKRRKKNRNKILTRYGFTFGIKNGNRPTAFPINASDNLKNIAKNNKLPNATIWKKSIPFLLFLSRAKLPFPNVLLLCISLLNI